MLYIHDQTQELNENMMTEYKVGKNWYEFKKISQNRAVINDSLFLRFMKKKITRTKSNRCQDFIVLKFNYDADYRIRERQEEQEENSGEADSDKKKNKIPEISVTAEDLRTKYYKEGMQFTYYKTNKAGVVVDSTTVKYKMLMRSPGKAKDGECIFIRESLYDKAIEYLTMGLYGKMLKKHKKNPDEVFNIVGLSAYETLTTATAYGYIQIPIENMLILKDIEVESEPMPAAIVSVKQIEQKDKIKNICDVEYTNTRIKNIIWDGMGLIDDSMFPEGMNGFIYCRSHFFKSCLFRGQMQQFFKDYCDEHNFDYETYTVKDMFGNERRLADVKVIVTDKSLKWLKFVNLMGGTKEKAYQKYVAFMKKHDNYFSIVKTAHHSKWGDMQLTTYQMNNTLPTLNKDVLDRITQRSVNYYYDLKEDKNYLKYLEITKSNFNTNELLLELIKLNPDFLKTDLYRNKKKKDLTNLKAEMRQGRLFQSGDNLTIMDNPVALLRYAAGDPEPLNERCFQIVEDGVQCYTTRFKDGVSLAAFRSPHNSPNNIIHLWNTYSEPLMKYFPNIGDNVIVFNSIGTDTQPRLSGHDVDSDFVLVTDQPDIADLATTAYTEYPTIINAVEEVTETGDCKTAYHLTMEDYARMDNKISAAQASIGVSTDVAQLALSYYFDGEMTSEELKEYIIILSVLGQISIDLAKKEFVINVVSEIMRIRMQACMKRGEGESKYPEFYAETKAARNNKKFKPEEVGYINCPMDIMRGIIEDKTKSYAERTKHISIYKLLAPEVRRAKEKNHHRRKKFMDCVDQYRSDMKELNAKVTDKDSKNYIHQRQSIEDMFLDDATKGLDQEQINYIVNMTVGNREIRNTVFLFLYRKHRQELLKCFVENQQK